MKKIALPILVALLVAVVSVAAKERIQQTSKANSFCTDCGSKCVVVCRQNQDGSQTPICGKYGIQTCNCDVPIIASN